MHHPIQMKPADTENRNGRSCLFILLVNNPLSCLLHFIIYKFAFYSNLMFEIILGGQLWNPICEYCIICFLWSWMFPFECFDWINQFAERKLFIGMVCKKNDEEVKNIWSEKYISAEYFREASKYTWSDEKNKIWCFPKPIPNQFQFQDIRQMFDKFGPVEEVTVLRDDQGVSRGNLNHFQT